MSKQKIAILGGGVGAMATAFELSSSPGWKDKYELTVYQLGWRIGGKGASGRNRATADRIEEHGLHIWMGFYENAFRVIRRAYEECNEFGLTPNSPFTSWDKAFSPMNLIVLTEKFPDQWKPWDMYWPPNDMVPGEGDVRQPKNAWECLVRMTGFVVEELDRLSRQDTQAKSFHKMVRNVAPSRALAPLGCLGALLGPLALLAPRLGFTLVHDLFHHMSKMPSDPELHTDRARNIVLELIDRFLKAVFEAIERDAEEEWEEHDLIRRWLIVADTALTILRGILEDDLLERGFEAVDDKDFVEWMRDHGARWPSSVLTTGMYDSSFAYLEGNPERPDFAAGTTLYGSLRLMFTYKGSIMWHMNAGMGDTIFTPLYLVLKKRGVKFEFFQKVTSLHASRDGRNIDSIDIDVQATVKPEWKDGYDPVIPVETVDEDGNPRQILCWPSEPRYEKLVEGEDVRKGVQNGRKLVNPNLESWWTDWHPVGKRMLKRGEDFDQVVLGISLGALPYIAKEMIDDQKRWRDMVAHVKTVRTQALQLWLHRDRAQVGWKASHPDAPLLCSFEEPFDTWCDMSHLIVRETWTPKDNVKQIAYFCNSAPNDPLPAPFSDHRYPEKQLESVWQHSYHFLNNDVSAIWPKCMDPRNRKQFNWAMLVDREGGQGAERLKSQFVRLNVDPSEQYVLSVKGSTKHRLRPWESGYDNLVLAGDWTLTDVNIGCVEAAVMSGMMASHTICGYPDVIFGAFGIEHPLDRRTIRQYERHLRGPAEDEESDG